jgi:Holliday junction resolvase-like predicted endonuclease
LCCGKPAEAVNRTKKTHMYRATSYYLHKNNLDNAFVRFDVIEVYLNEENFKIEHLKSVEIL